MSSPWILILLLATINSRFDNPAHHGAGWHQTAVYRFQNQADCEDAASKMYAAREVIDGFCIDVEAH